MVRSALESFNISRRQLYMVIAFGLFIVFDIGLFGWLILNSLSQREIEQALLETQRDAEPIASGIEAEAAAQGSEDIYTLVRVSNETQTYIDSMLRGRELMQTVEIRDRKGQVVYQIRQNEMLPIEDSNVPRLRFDTDHGSRLLETEIPIGDNLGTLVIGVSEVEVERRIGDLRRALIQQASAVGGFTILLLIAGLLAFIVVLRRSKQLEEQAQRSEKMAYVGTLASGLAHEIRSPLNSLNLNMQMLEEEARESGGTGSQLRLLSITQNELRRLEGLATSFLAYAKPQPIELRKVRLVDLLRRLHEVMAAELKNRGVETEIIDRSKRFQVRVDPEQINQLLLNLVHNGVAAMENDRRPSQLRFVARVIDGRGALEISDNGEGIPDRVRVKMFDLFYSNRKGGTGLGLAIVQRIAEAHDATIEVESEKGEGTLVRILFPPS